MIKLESKNKNDKNFQLKVSEFKQVNKNLWENKSLKLSILNAIPHAVIGLREREIVFANKSVESVFGWKPEELIGENTRLLYRSDKEYKEIAQKFYSRLKEQQTYAEEFPCRRKNGQDIICMVSTSRIGESLKNKEIVVIYEDITERKKSEETFRKSQQEFTALFNSSPDAALYHDKEGLILNVNPRFTELFGHTLEELKGKNINQGIIFPQDKTREESEKLTKLALEGKVIEHETIRKKKDGTLVPVIISVSPVIIEGESKGVIAFFQDITKQKNILEKLKESEEKYRNLFENMPGAYYRTDKDGNLIMINPEGAKLFGYNSPEDILRKNVFQHLYFAPEERKKYLKKLEKNKGNLKGFELTLKKKDGNPLIISDTSHYYYDKEGNIAGVEGIFTDITERKKVEEALQKSQQEFISLFRSSPEALVYLDEKSNIVNVNPRFTETFGYTLDEVKGRNLNDGMIHTPDMLEEAKKITKKALKGHFHCETIRKKKDGTLFPVAISGSQVIINGKLQGLMALFQDITEHHKILETIKKSEERFHDLFENANDAIWTADTKGRYISVNRLFRKLLGYKKEELIGKKSIHFVDSESRQESIENYKKALSGKAVEYELNLLNKDGEKRIYLERLRPLKENGKIIGVQGIGRDITERKQNEKLQQFLYNISRAANSPITLDQLYKTIHQELGKIIDTTNFYIALLNEKEDKIYFPYHVDEMGDEFEPQSLEYKSLTCYVIRNKRSLLLNYDKIKKLSDNGELLNPGVITKNIFWFGVPFKVEDKVIGAMVVQSYTNPNLYSKKDIKLMEFVSNQVAIAIERKRAEESLRKSQQELANIFKNIPQAVVYLDENSNIKDISPRFTKLFGYTLVEIKGKNINEGIIHPPGKIEEGNNLDKTALSEGYFNYESIRKKKDGTLFPVSISGSNIVIDGQLKGIIGTYFDITERKKAEEALQKSQQEFASLFSSTPEALVYLDKNSNILNVNPRFTELFGYTTKEVMGRNIDDGMIHTPDMLEEGKKLTKEAFKKDFHYETIRKKKDGTLFPVAISGSRVITEGQFKGLIASYQDITERKKMEEELKKLAHYDVLTGCCNRGYGIGFFKEQLKLARRKKYPLLIAYIDIDNFKHINDSFGHQEGDKVLKKIAKIFKSTLREVDIIIRIGGDEFLLILPDSSLDDVPLIKKRMNSALAKLNQKLDKSYKISFTLGFSCYDSDNPCTIDELIQTADQMMYKEKKSIN